MNNVNYYNKYKSFSKEELEKKILAYSGKIVNNREYKHFLNDFIPSNVEKLRAILLNAHEKEIAKGRERELKIIRGRLQKVIKSYPIITDIVWNLPKEINLEILSKLPLRSLRRIGCVSKNFNNCFKLNLIININQQKLHISEALNTNNAKEAVEILIKNPYRSQLRFVNFIDFKDFDNECLEKLTRFCPKIEHLLIGGNTSISGDALKYLAKTEHLKSLEIFECLQLEEDTLKHLKNTKQLKSLNIAHCTQLEKDTLKHLANTKQLESLDIAFCLQLEKDALKNLFNTKQLKSLNIANCTQLEKDALKHLVNT